MPLPDKAEAPLHSAQPEGASFLDYVPISLPFSNSCLADFSWAHFLKNSFAQESAFQEPFLGNLI